MKRLVVMAGLALLPGVAAAQFSVAPPSKDAGRQVAGLYHVEPQHTEVLFSVLHEGFTAYFGIFSNASGTLNFVPQDPARMQVDVSVPVSSVYTPSDKLTGFLKSADWLDAARFPTMRFVSTSVKPTAPDRAEVTGKLTLHGVTRPVTWQAVFNGGGANPLGGARTVGFEVTGTVKRSAFGVSKYVPLVGDEVSVTIAAAFEK